MWQATFLMLKEDVPRGVGSLILPASRKLIFRASDERQRLSASIYMGKEYEVRDILHKVHLTVVILTYMGKEYEVRET